MKVSGNPFADDTHITTSNGLLSVKSTMTKAISLVGIIYSIAEFSVMNTSVKQTLILPFNVILDLISI